MTASFTPEQLQKLTEISRLPQEEQKRILPDFLKTLSPEQIKYLQEQQGQAPQQGSKCPFCLIAQKQLQAVALYEDELCIAVLDIRPATKGHTVVFPKQHVADLPELSSEAANKMFTVAQRLTGILEELEGCQGVNLFVANGTAAGQQLDHVLLHVIPRYADDKLSFSWEGKTTTPEELTTLAQTLAPQLTSLHPIKQESQPTTPNKPSETFVENDEEPFADF